MKRALGIIFSVASLVACNSEDPSATNETIDLTIVGTWQVAYSHTITGVRMLSDGTLEATNGTLDTLVFDGTPNTTITSYMFGTQENVIDLRIDNKIKIYRINSRGGLTITDELVFYEIRNDTLYSLSASVENAHKYHLQTDTLVIERIPDSNTQWTYTYSKYFKREL